MYSNCLSITHFRKNLTIGVNNSLATKYSIQKKNLKEEKRIVLNGQQITAFDKIMLAVNVDDTENCFSLDRPAASGKTFLYSTLMSVQSIL